MKDNTQKKEKDNINNKLCCNEKPRKHLIKIIQGEN